MRKIQIEMNSLMSIQGHRIENITSCLRKQTYCGKIKMISVNFIFSLFNFQGVQHEN